MKLLKEVLDGYSEGHSPHGECGLKSTRIIDSLLQVESLPAWGVWIEIGGVTTSTSGWTTSLPAWGVWIEITIKLDIVQSVRGHSPHGECGLKWAGGRSADCD